MKNSTIWLIVGGIVVAAGITTGIILYKRKQSEASSGASSDYSKFFTAVQNWINYMKKNNWGNNGNSDKQISDAVYQISQEISKGTKTRESLGIEGLDYAQMLALAKTRTYTHY